MLLEASVATEHWRTRKKEILAGKRYYVLNLYLYNILGNLEIVTIKPETKLTSKELKGVIDLALDNHVRNNPTLNYLTSYLTISA